MAEASGAQGLSPTLRAVADELAGGPCTAGDVVLAVLRRHGRDYAGGRAAGIAEELVAWPPEGRRRPVGEWYADARSMFESVPELHGRAAVVGLALADRAAGRAMVRAGLLAAVLAELEDSGFSPRGRERLATIPLAAAGAESRPVVLEHGDGLRAAAASPDGRRAVSFGQATVVLWNIASRIRLGQVVLPRAVRSARFDAGGRSVVALLEDGSVHRWRTDRRGDPLEMLAPAREVAGAVLCRDASTVVFRYHDQLEPLDVVDLASGAVARVAAGPRAHWVAVAPDATMLAILVGGEIQVFERRGDGFSRVAGVGFGTVRSFDCAGGQVVAAGPRSVDLVYGRSPGTLLEDPGATRVALNRAGTVVAVATGEGLTLVQPAAGVVLGRLPGPGGRQRLAFSLDDRRLLSAGPDGTVRVWDVGLDPPPAPPPPSTYCADRPDGAADLLDRSREVEAFASLIAARTVEAPLSIGIFGDWGSGKSWFMGQLRRRVAEIAADTRDSGARQRDVTFFKHIAQVEFNAWHYAEGDVLASLVDHIFNRLDVGPGEGVVHEEQVRRLRALAEAERGAALAQESLEKEAAALAAVEQERRDKEQLRRAKLAELEAAAPTVVVEGRDVAAAAASALEAVGWGRVPSAVIDLRDELAAARRELGRAGGVLAPLVRGRSDEVTGRRWAALFLLALGPLAAVVTGAVAAALSTEARAVLYGLGALVVGGVTGLAGFVRAQTTWLRRRLDDLARTEADIDRALSAQLQPLDDEIAALRALEVERREAVAAAAHRRSETLGLVTERQEALAEARPERLLEELIRATVRAGEYASRLGIVAQARRDFEKVSEMIRAVNVDLERAADLGAERDVRVNRIVLYIDDLDRCEPDKVVQVLQAVHLLLAFPLFVVVVGVDSRWVGRALRKQYPDLFGADGASPHDYLEKIFQIPYWLDHLDDGRTRQMLRGLAAMAPTRRGGGPGDGTAGAVTAPPPGGSGSASTPSPAPAAPAPPGPGPAPPDQVVASRELNPVGLELLPAELRAIDDLAGLVGRSPRALKRFINVYRLMKVRVADPLDFVDETRADADYKVVLYLLAMVTGQPDRAGALFDEVRAAGDGDRLDTPPGLPRTAEPYKRWVDEVARFSFHVPRRPAPAAPDKPAPVGPGPPA